MVSRQTLLTLDLLDVEPPYYVVHALVGHPGHVGVLSCPTLVVGCKFGLFGLGKSSLHVLAFRIELVQGSFLYLFKFVSVSSKS